MGSFNSDFNKGKKDREEISDYLNSFFSDGYKLVRIHSHLKTMTIQEKRKNNKLPNRLIPSGITRAMGLDYFLTKNNSKIPIRFMIVDGRKGMIYMKLPSEYKNDWKKWLNICKNLDYHFVIVDKKKMIFHPPIHINTFMKNWTPTKMESKGNKNRLNFSGDLSTVLQYLSHPKHSDLFGNSVIKSLENLIK